MVLKERFSALGARKAKKVVCTMRLVNKRQRNNGFVDPFGFVSTKNILDILEFTREISKLVIQKQI